MNYRPDVDFAKEKTHAPALALNRLILLVLGQSDCPVPFPDTVRNPNLNHRLIRAQSCPHLCNRSFHNKQPLKKEDP